MKLSDIAPGDILSVRGSGYLSDYVRPYKVVRVTKTQIIAVLAGSANTSTTRFRLYDGSMLPYDKYIRHYIFMVNGKKVGED